MFLKRIEMQGFKSFADKVVINFDDAITVVVVRPSMSETWAFFVRKFDVKRATLEQISNVEGKEEAINLLKFLVKGARILFSVRSFCVRARRFMIIYSPPGLWWGRIWRMSGWLRRHTGL